MSSGIITLWSEPAPPARGPSPLLTSAVVHILLVGLAWMGLHLSEMQPARPTEQYPLRFLTLDQPPIPPPRDLTSPTFPAPPQNMRNVSSRAPQLPPTQRQRLPTPKPPAAHAQRLPAASAPEGKPAQAARPELQTNQPAALQTLLQPDLPPKIVPRIPLLPETVIWTPEKPVVKVLTPPPPKELVSANVRPAPWRPNTADVVADVKIAPNTVTVDLPLPSPSTTTPIALPEQSPVNQILETAAREAASPTPARIASLAKLQLERGTVALPEVNEAAAGSPNSIAGDGPANSKGAGGAVPAQESGAASSGSGKGARPSSLAAMGAGTAGIVKRDLSATTQGSVAGPPGATSEPPAVPGNSNISLSPNTTLIRLPKDGQFNFVVVGSSVAEKYPDAPNPWGGRMAYSVYLHVGSQKNWILQYSLPRNAQATAGAMTSQPKAPWPYLIVRPHLPSADWNSDAIMVHGFLDTNGHFQKLAVIFPPEFSDANFVVGSLNQWEFRPAMENGHPVAVEVLLVIPDQEE